MTPKLWFSIAGVTLTLLLSVVVLDLTGILPGRLELITKYDVDKILERHDSESPTVFFYGSSLLLYSIDPNNHFDELGYQSLYFKHADARFKDSKNLVAQLLERRPEVLLLETNVLLNGWSSYGYTRKLRWRLRKNIRLGLHKLLSNKPHRGYPNLIKISCDEPLPNGRYQEHVTGVRNLYKRSNLSSDLKAWLRSISAGSTKVFLVDIPRSQGFESEVARQYASWNDDLNKFIAGLSIERIDLNAKLGADMYCNDGTHMNIAGAQRFTPLLNDELLKRLQTTSRVQPLP